jgi:hypothetical protein
MKEKPLLDLPDESSAVRVVAGMMEKIIKTGEPLAKVRNLPFDRLRVNGLG